MADERTKIIVELDLDKGSIKKVEKTAEKSGQKVGSNFGAGFKGAAARLGGAVTGLAPVFAAAAASIGAAFTLRESIQAAQRQEDAINKLNASLQRIGEFSSKTSADLQSFASSLQSVTRFGDEAVIENLAFAQSLGATASQSKVVVAAAADLAAALDIDLQSATRNVAKTLGGFAGELGEVIPELKGLTQEQLRAGAGVDLLASKFQGFAQRDVQTFSGAVDQLKNSFGDLLEEIGFFVTKSEDGLSIAGQIKEAFQGAAQAVRDLRISFQQTNAAESAERIKQIQVEIIDLEQAALKAEETFKNTGRLVFKSNAKEARAQIESLRKELTEVEAKRSKQLEQENALAQTQERVNQGLQNQNEFLKLNNDQLKSRLGTIGLDQIQILESRFEQENEVLRAAREKELITEAEFNARKLELENQFLINRDALLNAADQKSQQSIFDQEESFTDFAGNISAAFQQAAKDIKGSSLDIARTSLNVLAGGVGKAFQNVGAALAQGKNGFDAFKDAFKGVIADLASAVGDFFIKQGIGFLFTNPALGGGLIAAGIGLKILSGALGSSSGGDSGAAANTASGSFGGTDNFEPIATQETEERAEPETRIAVNISGDVLDSRETGLRIVDLLNDAFDRDGAIVTGAV